MRPLAFLFLAAGFACAAPAQALKPASPDLEVERRSLRTIAVCVLLDGAAPPEERHVREALAEASAQYEREVGIAFVIDYFGTYDGKLDEWPIDLAFSLRKACPERDELRFVFSERSAKVKEFGGYAVPDDPETEIGGLTQAHFGHVLIFSTGTRAVMWNPGMEHMLIGTLKHEIGHLFGLEHVADTRSFMHAPSDHSMSEWTDDIRRDVVAEKWRRWWPRN